MNLNYFIIFYVFFGPKTINSYFFKINEHDHERKTTTNNLLVSDASLTLCLFKVFRNKLLMAAFLKFIDDIFLLSGPLILRFELKCGLVLKHN